MKPTSNKAEFMCVNERDPMGNDEVKGSGSEGGGRFFCSLSSS